MGNHFLYSISGFSKKLGNLIILFTCLMAAKNRSGVRNEMLSTVDRGLLTNIPILNQLYFHPADLESFLFPNLFEIIRE
ncbi:hypothetical protein B0E43_16865 [Algoriphagus sp. A40]|nr:hypothetical protein B0E43_16865 [Algoriphagus sp. A40]